MFGDLDWPLHASRGLSAIAEFLVLYYDVEPHSLDHATAYYDVSISSMALCFNGETLLSPPFVHMDDKFFFFLLYILQ